MQGHPTTYRCTWGGAVYLEQRLNVLIELFAAAAARQTYQGVFPPEETILPVAGGSRQLCCLVICIRSFKLPALEGVVLFLTIARLSAR